MNFDKENGQKTSLPVCRSLTPFGDGLEFHSETDYEEKDAALDHKIKI